MLGFSPLGSASIGSQQAATTSAPSTPAATAVSLSFTNATGITKASLTGLNWAFFDQPTPDLLAAPVAKGVGETTDTNGLLVLDITGTTLLPGAVGWLMVSNSNGTINTTYIAFCGPATVS